MDFANVYAQGFARVAARVVPVHLARPDKNAQAIIEDLRALEDTGVAVVAYPELSVTGCSCGDLFLQDVLLDASDAAVGSIVEASRDLRPVIIVGAPVRDADRLYNCAVVVHRGRILGIVPTSYLLGHRQSFLNRWFSPAAPEAPHPVRVGPWEAPLGAAQIFHAEDVEGLRIHVEIGDDAWAPIAPSTRAAMAGATVCVTISASPTAIGTADERAGAIRSASARCHAAHVFTSSGPGESSTDQWWDGQTFVYECGDLLGTSERFPTAASGTMVDVDLRRITAARRRRGGVDADPLAQASAPFASTGFRLDPPSSDLGLRREVDRFPFVPSDPDRLARDCHEAFTIQVQALARRLEATGNPNPVIGVSGGLDSTHALLVCAKAMDLLGRPRSDILAFTLPGFATSEGTRTSAEALMDAVGATAEVHDIRPMATQMLQDLGHPFASGEPVYDVTFENVQAGVRTDFLFRVANQRHGLVVGTGDLSELALGWCTFGVGDHMAHYGVNAGVPKTLIQHLVRWVASQALFSDDVTTVLETIVDQEISPELVPPADGKTLQSTESIIGPYALHDFFLYHIFRFGEKPSRIAFLAWHAWRGPSSQAVMWRRGDDPRVSYGLGTIRGWLEAFLTRFFSSQFKRSTLPDGPRVHDGGTLSPRGDWKMPSDAHATTWLKELGDNVPSEDM
ncbi:MAG: NAD(+) synthase [Propionibacteriaceae bacterium]|nr:NAD(+) synthase [Propionibacteriaceae bacterium]